MTLLVSSRDSIAHAHEPEPSQCQLSGATARFGKAGLKGDQFERIDHMCDFALLNKPLPGSANCA